MSKGLVGKFVELKMVGGWELNGRIESSDPDKFIVRDDEGLVVAFRANIALVRILAGERIFTRTNNLSAEDIVKLRGIRNSNSDNAKRPLRPIAAIVKTVDAKPTEQESVYSGSYIPSDMLLDGEDEEKEPENTFSISFNSGKGFEKEGCANDTEEENGSSRKED